MHHFAAVDITTNKVVNKVMAVRGSSNPPHGNIHFHPLKDNYTVDIGHDWDPTQEWTEDDPALPVPTPVPLSEESTAVQD